jgi:hypothetical protein
MINIVSRNPLETNEMEFQQLITISKIVHNLKFNITFSKKKPEDQFRMPLIYQELTTFLIIFAGNCRKTSRKTNRKKLLSSVLQG